MFTDRNGNVWGNKDFYDIGNGRLIEEEIKTMSSYFVDDVVGGWVLYWN